MEKYLFWLSKDVHVVLKKPLEWANAAWIYVVGRVHTVTATSAARSTVKNSWGVLRWSAVIVSGIIQKSLDMLMDAFLKFSLFQTSY